MRTLEEWLLSRCSPASVGAVEWDEDMLVQGLREALHPTAVATGSAAGTAGGIEEDCGHPSTACPPGTDIIRCCGWGASQNADIQASELAASVQDITRGWNKCTQQWLERYVYLRFGRSLVLTYSLAALWHGIAPGYYLFFLSMPAITVLERHVRGVVSPWMMPPGYKHPSNSTSVSHWLAVFSMYNTRQCMTLLSYYLLCWIGTQAIMVYAGVVMFLQTWEDSWYVWGSMHYIGHIGVMLTMGVLYMLSNSITKNKLC